MSGTSIREHFSLLGRHILATPGNRNSFETLIAGICERMDAAKQAVIAHGVAPEALTAYDEVRDGLWDTRGELIDAMLNDDPPISLQDPPVIPQPMGAHVDTQKSADVRRAAIEDAKPKPKGEPVHGSDAVVHSTKGGKHK